MPLKASIIPVTAFGQNCSIFWDDGTCQATVIDPGGDVDVILAMLQREHLTVAEILLTHGHIDHAGGAAELKERAGGVPIIGPHEADRMLLDHLAEQGRAYGLDGARNVTPDHWLNEGEEVLIAGETFSVLHCPGHSPGSVVFFSSALRFAVVGDVLFQGSIGRTDFPYGDHAALINAITTKLLPLGDDIRFICGHGAGSDFGTERRTNPFLRG
ncbi:MBL fold metallo-hydrolase [Sabulicella rubraurantiaca]|uniref:MBL fold metallo-hydrolase n=1 Tax=Sabulicella rubraurantiaca TaxID=2811429 RepID=UPI002E27D21C|nr:MBL fold metallo-hydrolase [Sabulicella rubraurantiaca]